MHFATQRLEKDPALWMRILFENGTPKRIARSLAGHEVAYAARLGRHQLRNGELLKRAEEAG